ncbi:DUF5666 domain-containing protein [Photobacterium leiognathi]|uniref:DUF5666 domain-containing protein n=1 Tax=Photobacterium leiognathi TaxID=553611 RepID=UPI002732961A|nr:DUF5666 domain-containing protein [Photobacterium leiognathi]
MKKLVLAALVGFVLTGCGGGGGSDESKPTPPTPDVQPAAVQGAIQEVHGNDIIINGRRYTVSSVNYDKQELAEGTSLLKPQMMVQLKRQAKSGVIVELEPTFLGQITNVNHQADTFSINGVNLSFAGLSNEINNDDWVMVSALPMATNNGLSYKVLSVIEVENTDLAGHYELEGAIAQLGNESSIFKLGQVTVDYSNISLPVGIKNGDWVEVTGQYIKPNFIASEIELETYDESDNDHEIEGIITKVNSTKTVFELNARGSFLVDSTTRFEDGNKANLVVGELVEVTVVKGIAKEIEFERDFGGETGNWSEFEREGYVSSVSYDHFMIVGETFYVDAYTEFEDNLKLETLNGVYIDVEGVIIDGKKVAREIEREDD